MPKLMFDAPTTFEPRFTSSTPSTTSLTFGDAVQQCEESNKALMRRLCCNTEKVNEPSQRMVLCPPLSVDVEDLRCGVFFEYKRCR